LHRGTEVTNEGVEHLVEADNLETLFLGRAQVGNETISELEDEGISVLEPR